jgi:hypothetical protein
VEVPGPYDERNKSYLQLVEDNANDFPDNCFFRVLASRGVVTLRPDEYTPVALNSFIDRCDPNVDIAYATAAHPLPFEPVTLKRLTDTRHPHARGLVPFAMRGSQTKYFYPGSRIQLDNIVIGILSAADANAIVRTATTAAETAKNALLALVLRLRSIPTSIGAIDATNSGAEADVDREHTSFTGIETEVVQKATEFENLVKTAVTARDKVETSEQPQVDMKPIETYKAEKDNAMTDVKRLYAEILAAEAAKYDEIRDRGSSPVPSPVSSPVPATGFAFTDGQKTQLGYASAKLTEIGTEYAISIADTAEKLKIVTVDPSDTFENERSGAYRALYRFFMEIGTYSGPELAAAFATSTEERLGNIESADGAELNTITKFYETAVTNFSDYLGTIIARQVSIIRTLEGDRDFTTVDSTGLDGDPPADGANDETTANGGALYLTSWAKKIENALRKVGRNLFSEAGKWAGILEHQTLVSKYVAALGPYGEHVAEYQIVLNVVIEAVENDVREVWMQTAGKCPAGTASAAGLGATGAAAIPVPESASDAMEIIMTGIGDSTTAPKCDYSDTEIFKKLTPINQAAINAMVVLRQLEGNSDAIFAAPKNFQDTLVGYINARTNVNLSKVEVTKTDRNSFNSKVVAVVAGWEKFTEKGKQAKRTTTTYKKVDLPEVNFTLPSASGAAV